MKVINLQHPHHMSKENLPETVCAIGFFDGIHLGHQRVIKSAIQQAEEQKRESAVISFHPHPVIVLSNGKKNIKYITPPDNKIKVLEHLGIDRLYLIEFDKKLSSLEPQQFIDYFIAGLNVKHLVAGFDFTYGFKGAGNMNNIAKFAKDRFTFTTIEKVTTANEKISSTHIRELISQGQIQAVNRLLGRRFETSGTVIKGDQRGRTIGYPTANLQVHPDALLPKTGVYAVQATINDQSYFGMANLGFRPTFEKDQSRPLLEVHLFNMNENIYDAQLHIEWYKFIRSEKQFQSVDQLIAQLNKDETFIRNYFKIKD